MSRRGRWWRRGFALLAAVALVGGVRAWQQRGLAAGPAPTPVLGATIDGRVASLPRGRPVVVYFWATWCPVCKVQREAVASAARHVAVLSVAMQSGGPEEVAAWARDRDWTVPTVADPGGVLARAWGVRGVPTLFVLDGTGRIRFREVGYTTGWGIRLRAWLAGAGGAGADTGEPARLPVTAVTVVRAPRGPVAVVEGYLPDGCSRVGAMHQRREGDTWLVTIAMERPPDRLCTQAIRPVRLEVPLDGAASLPPGGYRVVVNGVEAAFSVP